MQPSVEAGFVQFSAPLEGVVTSLYADVKQLLTVGLGCLCDPVSMALSLPWVMPDGSTPDAAEISRQWHALKAQAPQMSKLHWSYAAKLTTMRLTDQGVLDVALGRLRANEKIMRSYLPNWDLFPAPAQLACCSMGWAIGAGWPQIFGNLRDACNAQNWTTAIGCCDIRTDGNPGVAPRNSANKLLFATAASVVAQDLPLSELYWPRGAPNASQRDQALRTEAELALANMPALDIGHDADSAAAYDDEVTQPNTVTPPSPTGPQS